MPRHLNIPEVNLGDVVTLQPIKETPAFEGAAQVAVERIYGKLVEAFRLWQVACTRVGHDFDIKQYEEVTRLQTELSDARSRLQFLLEAVESSHESRGELWTTLPPNVDVVLSYRGNHPDNIIVLKAKRNYARITATRMLLITPRRTLVGNGH